MSTNDNLSQADGIEKNANEEVKKSLATKKGETENATPVSTEEAIIEEVEAAADKNDGDEASKKQIEAPLASSVVESTSSNTLENLEKTESITPVSTEDAIIEEVEATTEKNQGNAVTEKQLDVPLESSVVESTTSDILEKKEIAEDQEAGSKTTEEKEIDKKDYSILSKEELIKELKSLVKNEEIQKIKEHVEEIKNAFNDQFNEEVAKKKEEFLAEGGNIIDFHYSTPLKKDFNTAYFHYREKRNSYYQNIKKDQQDNLQKRLAIIEELKNLPDTVQDTNAAYNQFKDIKERWHHAGAIPRDKYNNVWNTYHHHIENFYNYLHLNRDFRELDYKHNLDQKLKIIERANELAQETDPNRAFRELQLLHKIWKEELGPVAREYSDQIWDKFSELTRQIHENRQKYFEEQDKIYEKNLVVKKDIIAKINEINAQQTKGHGDWQKSIKAVEALRDQFFKAGKVPLKDNEATWQEFKLATKTFNTGKNNFYKSLKNDQLVNLKKKKELIKIAEDNKDNEDIGTTTALMKKIQADWKKIGHVPRKDSDRIWKQFKNACNAFFDRIHDEKNAVSKEEEEAFKRKEAHLDTLKNTELSGNNKADLKIIMEHINTWKTLGRVPFKKKNIEQDFNKILDELFKKLDLNREESELIKFQHKVDTLKSDEKALRNEKHFIKKKIDEVQSEITQLENNLQFFKHAKDDNPMVRDVRKNIQKHKENLNVWKRKYRQLKQLS